MDKQLLVNQYDKCFSMLSYAIKNYDAELWYDDKMYKSPVWQIVYHALFYANIYCSASEKGIIKWPRQKENYHFFGKKPWPPFEEIVLDESYSKDEMMDFLKFVKERIPAYLDQMHMEERCWPDWYDESQLEFQLNNIRHIQHHIAQIIERQDIVSGFQYDWQ